MTSLLTILLIVLAVESGIIAFPYLQLNNTRNNTYALGRPQSLSFPFSAFNQPISNDTDYKLRPAYDGSWVVNIRSSLLPSSNARTTEAQVAFAPAYPAENLSIPTIIVQERADGLLRVEYYVQNWPNTFGLVLYNSTVPSWTGGRNVTFRFVEFGPPSVVNPQLAPRPNGNLSIMVGSDVVLSDYPIAWANLAGIYLYGYEGSSFKSGDMQITFWSLSRG